MLEGMEKREPSCAVGRIINWSSHYGKNSTEGPEKLKTDLPYDPAIPLLGIYPDKTIIKKMPASLCPQHHYSQ